MPFYKISEMETIPTAVGNGAVQMTAGELMKAAMVTYRMGDGPPPHFHPNEEQFILMLEGKFNMILGDETRVVEAGDLIHIPRNTRHGIHVLEGPARFFHVKSPVGDGHMEGDYNQAADADGGKARLADACAAARIERSTRERRRGLKDRRVCGGVG